MATSPTMLDLCCGLGGASSAMRARGWRVVTVDNHTDVRPSVCADVRALPLKPFALDLLWASPPCESFSVQRLPFGNCAAAKARGVDLSVPRAVRGIIDTWAPRVWMVENVWAAEPWFTPLFGLPILRLPGHFVWSNIALLVSKMKHRKRDYWDKMPHGRRRYLQLSLVPEALSMSAALAVERFMEIG